MMRDKHGNRADLKRLSLQDRATRASAAPSPNRQQSFSSGTVHNYRLDDEEMEDMTPSIEDIIEEYPIPQYGREFLRILFELWLF